MFASATTEAWVERFSAADIPCGPVLSLDQTFADPQVRHLDLVAEVALARPDDRVARVLRYPVTLSETPATVRSGPPRVGADTAAVRDGLWGADR